MFRTDPAKDRAISRRNGVEDRDDRNVRFLRPFESVADQRWRHGSQDDAVCLRGDRGLDGAIPGGGIAFPVDNTDSPSCSFAGFFDARRGSRAANALRGTGDNVDVFILLNRRRARRPMPCCYRFACLVGRCCHCCQLIVSTRRRTKRSRDYRDYSA